MNPYKYSHPPICAEILESPTKLKAKYWPKKPLSHQRRTSAYNYITFCIGLFLGIFLTSIIRAILKHNVCSYNSVASQNEVKLQLTLAPQVAKYERLSNVKTKLIYIGVMTANKYLDTRAKAIYETWGKHVPGTIAFFSSENSYTKENIPLIRLTGVDDSYPPQKKSFLMLKYMYDNHLHDYEYFMRADDDVYIRTERLEKFLKSINSSNMYYIGQAGRGNPDEFGHLSLSYEQNFCMGGPGMIFTKSTLEKMAPHLRKCLKNLKSFHEDVEIGRCVQKYAGIPCTWSYEMQNIFYHNNSDASAFTGPLNQKEVHRAITLHPIKKTPYLHRLHAYIKSLTIKEKEFEVVDAMREMAALSEQNGLKSPSLDDHLSGVFVDQLGGARASLQKPKPEGSKEALAWSFCRQNAYQVKDANPRHRMTSYAKESSDDVIRDVMEIINRLSKERGRVIDFKEILYSYSRHHPTYSAEYIFDLLLVYKKYRGKKATLPVRRHAYVQIPFGPLHVRELTHQERPSSAETSGKSSFFGDILNLVPNLGIHRLARKFGVTEAPQRRGQGPNNQRINFIVPLAGRLPVFRRFLDDFVAVCLKRSENVRLIVMSFDSGTGAEDTGSQVENLLRRERDKYPGTPMSVVKSDSKFARALALEKGAALCADDDLLFFVDVDITFTSEALERIRLHTVQGKQVYYPVVFSEFDPSVHGNRSKGNHFMVDEVVGYWRSFGYGIVSLYNSDLRRVGGFDTSIVGWGKEDVDLFEKVLQDHQLKIVRAPDPGMVHVYHRVECDPALEPHQLVMCQGTQFSTYASLRTLAGIVARNPGILEFDLQQE